MSSFIAIFSSLQIITLNNLHTLNIPHSSYLVMNIQNALLWKCRSSQPNMFSLILSYANQTRNQSEICEKIFNEIIRTIEMRWVEINDPNLILSLIYRSEHFSDVLLAKFEDQMTSEAETYPTDTLIAVSGENRFSRNFAFKLSKIFPVFLIHIKRQLKASTDAGICVLKSRCLNTLVTV